MSNIDPTRLSAIFRTLSSKDVLKTTEGKHSDDKAEISTQSVLLQKALVKDKTQLKNSIRQRIAALKKAGESLENKAPLITIQEILLWEFGDDIMNHPDFNYLSNSIAAQVKNNGELMAYLQKFVEDIE